jgi:hypothetical protein
MGGRAPETGGRMLGMEVEAAGQRLALQIVRPGRVLLRRRQRMEEAAALHAGRRQHELARQPVEIHSRKRPSPGAPAPSCRRRSKGRPCLAARRRARLAYWRAPCSLRKGRGLVVAPGGWLEGSAAIEGIQDLKSVTLNSMKELGLANAKINQFDVNGSNNDSIVAVCYVDLGPNKWMAIVMAAGSEALSLKNQLITKFENVHWL